MPNPEHLAVPKGKPKIVDRDAWDVVASLLVATILCGLAAWGCFALGSGPAKGVPLVSLLVLISLFLACAGALVFFVWFVLFFVWTAGETTVKAVDAGLRQVFPSYQRMREARKAQRARQLLDIRKRDRLERLRRIREDCPRGVHRSTRLVTTSDDGFSAEGNKLCNDCGAVVGTWKGEYQYRPTAGL